MEIDNMVNLLIRDYKNQGICIYDLEEKNEYFITSKRTIIDILSDRYQGNKKNLEYKHEF